jgi:signal transduction histidine kinase
MRLPLRSKLILILTVPLLVLLGAAARGVQATGDDARRGDATAQRVELALAASTAALELAHERVLSAQPPGFDTRAANELTFQRDKTTDAVDSLRATISDATRSDLAATPALDQLDRLTATRQAVDQRDRSPDEVLGAYNQIIDPVLELDQVVQLSGSPAMMLRLDAYQSLSRALQEAVVEQGLLRSVFANGHIDTPTYNRLVGSVTSQRVWFDLFERDADADQLARYVSALGLPASTTALRLRELALAAGPGGVVREDPAAWNAAMERKITALEAIADDAARDLAADARAQRGAADQRQGRAMQVLAAAVVLSALLLVALWRWALRPLQRLSTATGHAATVALPAAVDLAQNEGPDAARRALPPVAVPRERDLAELAEAFNGAQTAALALASDEAELRSKVHAVFLNFGRRTQELVTRQLGHIDDLEARTEDPDTLSDLFLLDHLSTRLRRNAESLVVMAGAESPRPWSRPVSVMNVVRAAVAEAVDYSRVDVEGIAPGAVVGAAANDVSHLVAELVDNALAFSSPDSRIRMAGRWTDDGRYLVTVTSSGTGMSADQMDEANERISGSSVSDPGMSRYFGMFVVGRFARRHGIEVRLVPARPEGTTAEVLLPGPLTAGAPMECRTTTGS